MRKMAAICTGFYYKQMEEWTNNQLLTGRQAGRQAGRQYDKLTEILTD